MNELNKLIQQYETETRQHAHINRPFDWNYTTGFVEWLVESFMNSFDHMNSQINSLQSLPTCGKEQRKFLDTIEQFGAFDDGDRIIVGSSRSIIDIEKVSKGE